MSSLNQFNYPLTNFCVGWWNRQAANPLEFIAPIRPVDGMLGTFKRYPQGYAFRSVDTRRSPMTPGMAIDVGVEDVPFQLEDHTLRVGVDDSETQGNPGQDASAQIAQSKMGTLLSVWRTSAIKDGFSQFSAAISAEAGRGAWSGASSDPIEELQEVIQAFRLANGVTPNRLLFADEAWNKLLANAAVQDYIAYNNAKILTPELLLKLLQLDSSSGNTASLVMHSTIPQASANPGPGVTFAGTNVLGSDLWMTYVDDDQEVGNMSGLATLALNGSYVDSVMTIRQELDETTWHKVKMYRKFVVTAPTCTKRITVS